MSIRLKELVEEVVLKIYDPDYISSISRVYGEEHVELKTFGFKPDFWVAIADAITIEGVILDMANHQPADTVAAWSQLVTMMFSAVRDGYYTALRKHRMSSRRCLRRQTTVDSEKDTTNSTPDVNLSVPELQSVQQTTKPIKSTSMSSVESEGNDSSKKYAGSINIMAPVENPRCTVAASNGRTGSFRAIGVVGNANSVTTVSCRPRPIFE